MAEFILQPIRAISGADNLDLSERLNQKYCVCPLPAHLIFAACGPQGVAPKAN